MAIPVMVELADKLGIAFRGEEYDLIEKLDGWYKIDFYGREGYIKADFVKIN